MVPRSTSPLLLRRASALESKPVHQGLLASPEAAGRIQGRSLRIARDPVQIGPEKEQVFRHPALTAGTRVPKGLRDGFGLRRVLGKQLFQARHQAESGRVP